MKSFRHRVGKGENISNGTRKFFSPVTNLLNEGALDKIGLSPAEFLYPGHYMKGCVSTLYINIIKQAGAELCQAQAKLC